VDSLFYFPSSMLWPLVACLVLTGIHVYLGVHVIARKVIFVDLALAQIAALGTVVGILMGYEAGKDSTALYLYSLGFTIFGAFIFSITRMRGERVPHEAIIGIVYAVTFALTMLVLSRSPLGPQELDHIIKGELLWVQQETVLKTLIIYAVVGLFHFVFRKQFMAISFDPEDAERRDINVRLWDFLFYMSFGFVITSSVAIAGVFLVFSYLVIPAVGAMLLSEKLGTRLAIGWIGGAIISFLGVRISWSTGLPTSPLIVCILAVALILSGIVRYLRKASDPGGALVRMAGAAALIAVFVAAVFLFRKEVEDPLEHSLHMLQSRLPTERVTALQNLIEFAEEKSKWIEEVMKHLADEDAQVRKAAVELLVAAKETERLPQVLQLLDDPSYDVRRSVIAAARRMATINEVPVLLHAVSREEDPEIKVAILETVLELGGAEGIPHLIQMIREGGIFADDAYHALRSHVALDFDRSQVSKAERWWTENQKSITWDPATKMFRAKPSTSIRHP
jgi:zinc/manganese transport system permease protein